MNVLLVAATEAEAAVFIKAAAPGAGRDGTSQQGDSRGRDDLPEQGDFPERNGLSGLDGTSEGYVMGNLNLSILVTGIGSIATAWALTRRLCTGPRPDLVINAGIAGSFRDSFRTGDVVMPVSDCFADAGIESAEGFLTLSEAGLQDPDNHPFTKGRINTFSSTAGFQYSDAGDLPSGPGDQSSGAGDQQPSPFFGKKTVVPDSFFKLASGTIRSVNAVTVSTVTGSLETAGRLMRKYDPDIETMEGAAFFFVCSREAVPFIALRAVSNRVGIRDRGSWNIPLALENLTLVLENLLKKLC